MAKQERTVHVFDGTVDLSRYPGEVVARNDRWTSFRPKKPTTFDSLPISKDTGFVVFDMWFIDDEGIVSRVHQHGLLVGVFALPDHESAHNGSDLADVFELYDAITKAEMKTLKKHHTDGKRGYTKWVMSHGLETLLGLPEVTINAAAPAKKKAAAKPKKKAARRA